MADEKHDIEHVEVVLDATYTPDEDVEPIVTPKTWVVVGILSLGYGLSFWPIPVFAAIQGEMAASFGTPNDYVWFIPAWSLAITVCFMICGPNTDLFGRRWFLVGGNLVCFAGHIVVATAKSANAVIAGSAIIGFGGANCQMAAFALCELLPNKWRHLGVVFADIATLVAVIVGPVTARYGIYVGNWRWNFYAAAIAQALSFIGLYTLYYPPAHPNGLPYAQAFREMDYVGMLLFIAGATPFLMGIIYTTFLSGGDAHIVACLVVGAVFLVIFALWEHFAPKRGLVKHPLTPTHLFTRGRGRDLTAPCIAVAIINMFYYSSSILYPTMINVFFNPSGSWKYASALSIVQGCAIASGVVFLSLFGSKIKHWNWQLAGYCTGMVLFGALLALGTPERKGMMVAFCFLSQFFYSPAIYLVMAVAQLGVEQKDLGLAGGLSGTTRFAGGAVATAVYTAVLTNTVKTWTVKLVPAAAVAAGLSASDVPSLMAVVGTPALATTYSPQIAAAVGGAVVKAYEKGIQVTAGASVAFGVIGIVACAYCRDIEPKMTNKIEIYMENTELAGRNKFH